MLGSERTGPLGEMTVLPPRVELSAFKLGPRFTASPTARQGWIGRCSPKIVRRLHAPETRFPTLFGQHRLTKG